MLLLFCRIGLGVFGVHAHTYARHHVQYPPAPNNPHTYKYIYKYKTACLGIVQGPPRLERVQVMPHGQRHARPEAKGGDEDDLAANDW